MDMGATASGGELMQLQMSVPVVAILIAIVACAFDLRTRRIPNALTFGAALAALVFHRLTGGTEGAMVAAGGWVVGLGLFLPFFVMRGMGGGDVKLLAALGAWLGPEQVVWLAVYTGIAGGVMGVWTAVANGYLKTAMRNVFGALIYWGTVGLKPVPGLTLESGNAPRLAYALPILAGTLVTLWL
jgi:prepilin peptidase CpaA